MIIRKGKEEDIDFCIKLSNIPEVDHLRRGSDESLKSFFKWYIDEGIFIVVEENNEVIGFLNAQFYLGDYVYVDGFVIGEGYRGKGIGKQLIGKFRETAKNKNAKYFSLLAPKFNENTIKFYEKLGMRRGEEWIEFFEDL